VDQRFRDALLFGFRALRARSMRWPARIVIAIEEQDACPEVDGLFNSSAK
jgi:hypothetical protein